MRDAAAFLNDCLVDSETQTKTRRRSTRQRALATAVFAEMAIISGFALWPLIVPAALPQRLVQLAPLRADIASLHRRRSSPHVQAAAIPSHFSTPRFEVPIVHQVASLSQTPSVPVVVEDEGPDIPFGPDRVLGDSSNDAMPVPLPKPVDPTVRIVRRSEGVQESQLIFRVIPTYPQMARIARVSGDVELEVLVGTDGRVLSVEVLSGSPLLAASAKQAVEEWRYRPAILDGHAVEVESHVTVRFVMDE